jgi:uncharacterized membrane-anchored protein YitT (DUF2179 family)
MRLLGGYYIGYYKKTTSQILLYIYIYIIIISSNLVTSHTRAHVKRNFLAKKNTKKVVTSMVTIPQVTRLLKKDLPSNTLKFMCLHSNLAVVTKWSSNRLLPNSKNSQNLGITNDIT